MNKPIINGIDVSECYADKKMMKDGLYCFWEGGSCADNKFCYFKELKGLQEKNEELRKEVSNWKNLKPIDITEFCKVAEKTLDSNSKYKQALEEIREIINEQKPPLDKAISQSELTLERLCAYEEKYIKIVGIIDEVLNDNRD